MDQRPFNLTRADLGTFLNTPKTVDAFENLNLNNQDVFETITGIQGSALLSLSLSPSLNADRRLINGADITFSDGGPKGNVAPSLAPTGVSASTYGSAARFVSFNVDAKGRITVAAQYNASTDNVAEGATNLYFTQSRARLSISAGSGLTYNNVTGAMSLTVQTAFGTYSPTFSDFTNITGVTLVGTAKYTRMGDTVDVSVFANVQPTATGALTAFDIALPVASNLAGVTDCIGVCASGALQQSGFVIADFATDKARVIFFSTTNAAADMAVNFKYKII